MAKLDSAIEIWKPLVKIVKNNGREVFFDCKRYRVSNFGNLKNSKKFLSNKKMNSGYIKNVLIDINCVEVNVSRHHVVLQTFNGVERFANMIINHIDGNKQNNRIENLEWCTSSENTLHAYSNNLIRKNTTKVLRFSIKGDFIKMWDSIAEVCLKYNVGSGNICRVMSGKSHSIKNYIWRREVDSFDKYEVKIKHLLNVAQIDNGTKEIIRVYKNSLQASKVTKISNCNISRCLNKQRKTAGCFIWENTEQQEGVYGKIR